MNSAHSFTEGMDVPSSVTKEEKNFISKVIIDAYNKGYSAAGKNLKEALNLIPATTLSKEHIFKLIDIVQKVSESK